MSICKLLSTTAHPKSCVFRNITASVRAPTHKKKTEHQGNSVGCKGGIFIFLLLNRNEMFLTVIVSACQMASEADVARVCFEQDTAFKVRTSLSNQQVSTLPGCLSKFPSCYHLRFASPFCNCSCYVNCVETPTRKLCAPLLVPFYASFFTYTKQQHKHKKLPALSHNL